MRTLVKLVLVFSAACLSVTAVSVAHAQSANEWYPTGNTGLTVMNVSFITHADWNSQARIGVEFTSGLTAYYYYSPSDPLQTELASILDASLATAEIHGTPVFVYVTGADAFTSGTWDFDSVQIGNN